MDVDMYMEGYPDPLVIAFNAPSVIFDLEIVDTESNVDNSGSAYDTSAACSPTAYSPISTVAGDNFDTLEYNQIPLPLNFSSSLNEGDHLALFRQYYRSLPQVPAIRPIDTVLNNDGPGSAPWDDDEWDDFWQFEPQFALESSTSLSLPSTYNFEHDEIQTAQVQADPESGGPTRSPPAATRHIPYEVKRGRPRKNPPSSLVHTRVNTMEPQNLVPYGCQCGQSVTPLGLNDHLKSPPHSIRGASGAHKVFCPWQGCVSAYSGTYRLGLHIREKHWGITYPCQWCHETFGRKDKLIDHVEFCPCRLQEKSGKI
ncbi:hypothetical protein L218DRAFT_951173 [Marasmius fiardii PR-910]|nr:hypothetical protein L218DRAFT_951173 [Marasmius fiardii PR-910]